MDRKGSCCDVIARQQSEPNGGSHSTGIPLSYVSRGPPRDGLLCDERGADRSGEAQSVPPHLPEEVLSKWQGIVDLMAKVVGVPAGLIMRVDPPEIEVIISSATAGNPYFKGERASLNTGLYCEKVMEQRSALSVPDARKDPAWDHNPDLALGMVCYLGFPVLWPDGTIFGTICVLDQQENPTVARYQELIREFGRIIETDLLLLLQESERRREEEALRESEERYRLMIENAPDAIAVFDAEAEVFVDANTNAERLFECSREELLKSDPLRFLTPVQPDGRPPAESLAEYDQRALAGESLVFERIIRNTAGREFFCEIRLLRLPFGKRKLIRASYSDITDRKHSEMEKLRASEERFKSMFNQAPLGIAVVDSLNGRFASVNPMFAKIAGRTVEEMERIDWISVTHPDDIQEDLDRIAAMNAGKIAGFQMEKRYRRPDGSYIWINMTVAPMYVEDKAHPRHLLMIEEITERKRMEKNLKATMTSLERAKESAEEASRSKDRFLATLSHELRTPLTPILALTSALAAEVGLGDALRRDMDAIQRNVELEARLIDDLLDVTRIIHGKINLDKRTVDLCEVIRRVVEVCREDIKVRRIHFGVQAEGGPYPILADATRLQQVFWNLLKNALKFTPEGGCISIQCRRAERSVVVEIKDSGKGIAVEDLGRIFNPFEQIDRKERGAQGGLGLGLAISKGVVEMHEGSIEARSEGVGQGATFCVTLPLAEAVVPVAGGPAIPPAPAAPRGLRILLVEDHGDTARILSRLLRNQGHEVQTAGDLNKALEKCQQWEFDLLISDLGLPDGDGRDLMRQLHVIRPGVPGIAISGFGTEGDVHQSLAAGFMEHLVKPVNITTLRKAIQRLALPFV